MLLRSLLLLTFCCTSSFANADDTTRVLFVGNSLTYYNNMPVTFQNIAANLNRKVKIGLHAPGGSGFINHVNDPVVYDLFRQKWDVVVLQPGTGESAGASSSVMTSIVRGRQMQDSIYKYNACAKVFLYQIPYSLPSPTAWSTYFSVQNQLRDSVGRMADSLRLQMIAAGECVRAYYTHYPNFALHTAYNDIHPGPLGSYLIACAAYATIFQDSLTHCSYYGTVHQDTARKFFRMCDSTVLRHKPTWRINSYNLHAGFSYTNSSGTLNFTNLSTNYTTVLWKFGDGNSSTQLHPQHSYSSPGIYTVTLYALTASCSDSLSYRITTHPGLDLSTGKQLSGTPLQVFPNPSDDLLTIRSTEVIQELRISDLNGKPYFHSFPGTEQAEVRTAKWPAGLYLVSINGDRPVKFIRQ